jgi:hypothetical protein
MAWGSNATLKKGSPPRGVVHNTEHLINVYFRVHRMQKILFMELRGLGYPLGPIQPPIQWV